MSAIDFDVVLYGATGFVGRQTVDYFVRHAPSGLRWAIAGRDRAKLEALGAQVPILIGEAGDQAKVDAIVARTRVLLTTAGPFKLYGDPFVDACVRLGVHYVDISGETARIRDLIDRYHLRAEAARVRVVNFCAISSAPADLGVYLLKKHLGGRLTEAKGFFQLGAGMFSGGTIASIDYAHSSGDVVRERDVFLLSPEYRRPARPIEQDQHAIRYDRDIRAWTTPSPMAVSDTRAVRRSSALTGNDIVYQEYVAFPGRAGLINAIGFKTITGILGAALGNRPTRSLLQKMIPPGHGPSEQTMDSGWFELRVRGKTDTGAAGMVTLRGKGDPGNRITVKCVCESALAIVMDEASLPKTFGVLTPSLALGDVFARRLAAAGIEINIEPI